MRERRREAEGLLFEPSKKVKKFYAVYHMAMCEEGRGYLEADGILVALEMPEGISQVRHEPLIGVSWPKCPGLPTY